MLKYFDGTRIGFSECDREKNVKQHPVLLNCGFIAIFFTEGVFKYGSCTLKNIFGVCRLYNIKFFPVTIANKPKCQQINEVLLPTTASLALADF